MMKTRTIVVGSQHKPDCDRVTRTLRYLGRTVAATDGFACLRMVLNGQSDLLVLFPGLGGMIPAELVHALRREREFTTFPVIYVDDAGPFAGGGRTDDAYLHVIPGLTGDGSDFVFAVMRALSQASADAWQKLPEPQREFLTGCRSMFEALSFSMGKFDAERLQQLHAVTEALIETVRDGMVLQLLEALEQHDDYTLVHSMRVAALLVSFAISVKISLNDAELLAKAGLLHDIGKLSMPKGLLVKPGPLDENEWEIMRSHPDRGVAMLQAAGSLPHEVAVVTRGHHERVDGSGYPRGLKGRAIDDLSMLGAVADVYSALTERRAYKAPLSPLQAAETMQGMTGRLLDPQFVKRFLKVIVT